MPHRNALSLVRRLTVACLCAATCSLPAAALAESSVANDRFPMLSLLMPSLRMSSLAEPAASAPEDALTIHEMGGAAQPMTGIDLTTSPDNLWDRLRTGFAMTNLNDDLTLHYQQWYQNRPDALRRMVERSRPYLHYIIQEIEARGMPTELALLPMVESSFNPMAYSRANASGLWQFIPATGKRFNLEQNWWQDQRRDIVASTGAALDYLQAVYDMHGDWHLALASYNWGEGAVKRAVEKNMARRLPTDYASLNMPNETRHYVPKLQALKNIFGNPVLMVQLRLPEILNRPYFATIDTEKPMDVKTAARFANMPVDEFLALNPSHNRPVIKADSAVVLPADKLNLFRSNLQSNAGPLTEWQTYTLKHGDNLNQLAPRFGIALPDLLKVNGLPTKIRLGAGSTVLVPAGKGADDLSALPNTPSLPQIIEPEPVIRSHGKLAHGKNEKQAKSHDKRGGKAERTVIAKGAKPPLAHATPRSGKTLVAHAAKPAGNRTKSSPPAKVARSGNGRRG